MLAHKKLRKLRLENLENRQLMAGLTEIADKFNYGMLNLRTKADDIAINALTVDVPHNMPVVGERDFASSLNAPKFVRELFRGTINNSSTVEAAIADLTGQGFIVEQFSTDSDVRGDFVRLTRRMTQSTNTAISIPVADLEGIPYFQSAVGSFSGTLSGKVESYTGTITLGLDATGFYFGASSTVGISNIAANGSLAGSFDLGSLDNVSINSRASISGSASIKFQDVNHDSKLRLSQLSNDEVIMGSFSGSILVPNAQFKSKIPGVSSISWNGNFNTAIQNGNLKTSEKLVAPTYASLLDSMKLGFTKGLKELEWVKKFDSFLTTRLPYLNKSLGEMLKTDEIVDKAMDSIGIKLLPISKRIGAMNQLIRGQNVDLVNFKGDLSTDLGEWNVVGPKVLLDYNFLGGVASATLTASVTANLALKATIDVGISTQGFWVNDTTSIGINGGIWGKIEGTAKLFSLKVASASGSLGIAGDIKVHLTSPVPGESRIYVSSLGSTAAEIAKKLQDQMALDFTVSLSAKAEASIAKIIKWKKEKKLVTLVDYHSAGSGNTTPPATHPLVASQLSYEGEQMPVVGASNGLSATVVTMGATPGIYSNDAHLVIRSQGNGWVDLQVNSDVSGQHALQLTVTKNRRQSAIQVSWNGQILANRIDLSKNNDGSIVEVVDLGIVDLQNGSNVLRVELLNGDSPEDDIFREISLDGLDVLDSGYDGQAPDMVQNLHVENLWTDMVDLQWNSQTAATNYVVEQKQGDQWVIIGMPSGSLPKLRVRDLRKASDYTFRVSSSNSSGTSTPVEISVHTKDTPPNAPQNLRTDNIFGRAVDLRWDDHSDNESEFRVAISTDGVNWNHVVSTAANEANTRITNLQPSTRYWFKVRAANAYGYSDYTSTLQIETKDVPPSAPINLVAANVWAKQIDLNWTDTSNNEAGFRVEISTNGTSWQPATEVTANRTGVRVSNLTANRVYYFRVVAFNGEGNSAFSNVLSVRTRP